MRDGGRGGSCVVPREGTEVFVLRSLRPALRNLLGLSSESLSMIRPFSKSSSALGKSTLVDLASASWPIRFLDSSMRTRSLGRNASGRTRPSTSASSSSVVNSDSGRELGDSDEPFVALRPNPREEGVSERMEDVVSEDHSRLDLDVRCVRGLRDRCARSLGNMKASSTLSSSWKPVVPPE
jgi:hypothetical protein